MLHKFPSERAMRPGILHFTAVLCAVTTLSSATVPCPEADADDCLQLQPKDCEDSQDVVKRLCPILCGSCESVSNETVERAQVSSSAGILITMETSNASVRTPTMIQQTAIPELNTTPSPVSITNCTYGNEKCNVCDDSSESMITELTLQYSRHRLPTSKHSTNRVYSTIRVADFTNVDVVVTDERGRVIQLQNNVQEGSMIMIDRDMMQNTQFPKQLIVSLLDPNADSLMSFTESNNNSRLPDFCYGNECAIFDSSCTDHFRVGDTYGHLIVANAVGNRGLTTRGCPCNSVAEDMPPLCSVTSDDPDCPIFAESLGCTSSIVQKCPQICNACEADENSQRPPSSIPSTVSPDHHGGDSVETDTYNSNEDRLWKSTTTALAIFLGLLLSSIAILVALERTTKQQHVGLQVIPSKSVAQPTQKELHRCDSNAYSDNTYASAGEIYWDDYVECQQK